MLRNPAQHLWVCSLALAWKAAKQEKHLRQEQYIYIPGGQGAVAEKFDNSSGSTILTGQVSSVLSLGKRTRFQVLGRSVAF